VSDPVHPAALRELALDHLVVACADLADGIAWCERTLGHLPQAGGRHAFMGTHNRILSIASARFPRAYLELIAIDPDGVAPAQPRWFGLDEPALQRALAAGPRLIHWVARCADVRAAAAAFAAAGFDPGPVVDAERATPHGLLRWQISVRRDGRRLADGAAPTLIQWGDVHPTSSLPPSGCALVGFELAGTAGGPLEAWLTPAMAGVDGAGGEPGDRDPAAPDHPLANRMSARSGPHASADDAAAAPIVATLQTPRGLVRLESIRLAPA
jgi:hypothetical protein